MISVQVLQRGRGGRKLFSAPVREAGKWRGDWDTSREGNWSDLAIGGLARKAIV